MAPTKEVWVTTPRDHSLTVLDASKPEMLRQKLVIRTEGDPEGYAVDSGRGIFYTNLEDKNRTLGIDVKTRAVKSTWDPGCGADGPRGIAVDETHNLVMVACTDRVNVLDGAHDGAPLGRLEPGAGVDNIDWLEPKRWLFVQCYVPACPTTLSGTVYDPAGANPLYNAVVFVPNDPNGALTPIKQGTNTCNTCDVSIGDYVTATTSAADGTFTLTGVPATTHVPLVVQIGKWRREVFLPQVKGCTNNKIAGSSLTRLPRTCWRSSSPRRCTPRGGVGPGRRAVHVLDGLL